MPNLWEVLSKLTGSTQHARDSGDTTQAQRERPGRCAFCNRRHARRDACQGVRVLVAHNGGGPQLRKARLAARGKRGPVERAWRRTFKGIISIQTLRSVNGARDKR